MVKYTFLHYHILYELRRGKMSNVEVADLKDSFIENLEPEVKFNLKCAHFDEEKLIIEDPILNKTFCVRWESILKGLGEDYIPNSQGLMKYVPNPSVWRKQYEQYNFMENNRGLTMYAGKGFYHRNYAEFFLDFEPASKIKQENSLRDFKIGDIQVRIGKPSLSFTFLHDDFFKKQVRDIIYLEDWEMEYTISLTNIEKEDIECTLQQALYVIHKFSKTNVYPVIQSPYKRYDKNIEFAPKTIKEEEYLKPADYFGAIAFFNQAKNSTMVEQLLNFYKAIEYFFIINQQEAVMSIVQQFNKKNEPKRERELVFRKLQETMQKDEETSLRLLLSKLEYRLNPVMREAREKGLIDLAEINTFAKALYKTRNKFVHAKEKHQKVEVWIPSILEEEDLYYWNPIFEKVADICIDNFCFKKQVSNSFPSRI